MSQKTFSLQPRSRVISTDLPSSITIGAAPTGLRIIPYQNANIQSAQGPRVNTSTTYNSGSNWADMDLQGIAIQDFILTGTTVTIGWRCQVSAAERYFLWIDGKPTALTPTTPGTVTVAGGTYLMTLTWATAAPRRVEICIIGANAIMPLYVPIANSVSPAPARPKVHIVGDSFQTKTAMLGADDSLPGIWLYRNYDISLTNDGLGGTGYVAAGAFTPFGSAARLAQVAGIRPDAVIVCGSVNDDAQTGRQAAASAYFAALRAINPLVKIIAIGPQPDSATATIATNRQNNVLDIAAACTGSNVPFYDIVGFTQAATGAVTAFSSGTTTTAGQVVSYLGSLWRAPLAATWSNANFFPGSGQFSAWQPLTLTYGTGNAGTPASDGNRDVLLGSDNVHPTGQATPIYGNLFAIALRDNM